MRKESALPVIGCCCPACGDLSLQRQRVKRLIMDLEREHPHVKASMMKALTNVMPRHLLDRRLAGGPAPPPAESTESPEPAFPQLVGLRIRVTCGPWCSGSAMRGSRSTTASSAASATGLLALVGVQRGDGPADVAHVAAKLRDLRIFDDDGGADGRPRMNRSVVDVGGSVLVVSQFTLAADTRRGRRPSFDAAAPPDEARRLYEDVVADLRASGVAVATGEFQAAMRVTLENDGPVTLRPREPAVVIPASRLMSVVGAWRALAAILAHRRMRCAPPDERGSEDHVPDTLTITKAHAYGNDFLFAAGDEIGAADLPALARTVCARHTGIGGDGLIVYGFTPDGATMHLLNADGSPSELSGNGLRCLAALVMRERERRGDGDGPTCTPGPAPAIGSSC